MTFLAGLGPTVDALTSSRWAQCLQVLLLLGCPAYANPEMLPANQDALCHLRRQALAQLAETISEQHCLYTHYEQFVFKFT